MVMAMPLVAMADAVGGAEIKLLQSIFTGYIGLALGLGVAALGAYTFAMGEASRGVFLLVIGVLITLLPMVFNAAHALVCPAVRALFGAACGG